MQLQGEGLASMQDWAMGRVRYIARVRVRVRVKLGFRLGLGLEEVFVFDSKSENKNRAVEAVESVTEG